MSLYLKNVGVLATTIHPGWVNTNMGTIDTVTSVRGIMPVMEKLQGEEGTSKIN
ncbi:hypothetical protein DPMN_005160 [Dreissena polymorpha]|uniref:C-factor n=2 Tax=Dreissena polymorpha TaxID=45954 RepID=A0A9D4RWK2_DREPO|nr:hypothetical protein DPMN_005160 [Dreissena polymorpha]